MILAKPLALIHLTTPPLSRAPRNTLNWDSAIWPPNSTSSTQPHIRFVDAKTVHGFLKTQTKKRCLNLNASCRTENLLQKALDESDDILSLDKGCFQIDLS